MTGRQQRAHHHLRSNGFYPIYLIHIYILIRYWMVLWFCLYVRSLHKPLSRCPISKLSTYSESLWSCGSIKTIWVDVSSPNFLSYFIFTINAAEGGASPGRRGKHRRRRLFREYSFNCLTVSYSNTFIRLVNRHYVIPCLHAMKRWTICFIKKKLLIFEN